MIHDDRELGKNIEGLVKQHPEWKYVEAWFKDRVGRLYPASDGLALYRHIEKIAVDVTIDEAVEQAARELGYQAGQQVAKEISDESARSEQQINK